MKKATGVLVLLTMLVGCASHPDRIKSSSVSLLQYKDYDCDQIAGELDRVNRKTNELYASLRQKANMDSAQMAVGMVLFWPALFFLEGGDGPEAAEYAHLKGERDTLEKVAVQKKCDPSIIPPKTDELNKGTGEESKPDDMPLEEI